MATVRYDTIHRDNQLIYPIMSLSITMENGITSAEAVLRGCRMFFLNQIKNELLYTAEFSINYVIHVRYHRISITHHA